jgi:hypothetical protein
VTEPTRRRRGAWPGNRREAADVLIRIRMERAQPLAGTAETEGTEPLAFDGWLELLRVLSELVAAGMSEDR